MARDAEALLLQVSADIRGLEKQFAKAQGIVNSGSKKMQKDAQGIGAAINDVFDNTRLKVFDSGAARVGVFGSALQKLGPVGLGAAAAIGAVALALNQAGQAIAFADELADTANRLHVTTDALQEYRYALRLAGGDEKGADEALEAFSVTLGKAQAGMSKALRGFAMLGFSAEQVKRFKDVDEGLKAVTEKIAGLGSNVQKDAVISQLGLNSMKPLILEGVDAMARLRDEAHKVGIVMDSELVRRGAAARDEFETVAQVVKVQLMSAFVDLGPVLVDLLTWAAKFAEALANIADRFREIKDNRRSSLEKRRDYLEEDTERAVNAPGAFLNGNRIKRNRRELAAINAELARRDQADKVPPPTGNSELTPTTKPTGRSGRSEADKAAERAARAAEAREAMTAAELRAQQALTDDIKELAVLRNKEIDAEAQRANSRRDRDVLEGKLDAVEAKRLNERQLALAEDLKTAGLEDDIRRFREDDLQEARRHLSYYERESTAALGAAQTAEDRYEIERRLLTLRQQAERDELESQLETDRGRGLLSDEDVAYERDRLGDAQAAERRALLLPLKDEYKNVLLGAFDAAKGGAAGLAEYFGDRLKARLLDNLAESLATSLANSGIGKGGFGGILSAGLNLIGIGKNASGTDNWRGGLTAVGERGKEIVNLPRGAQVIPNDVLKSLANMRVQPQRSATVIHSPSFNLQGAVMTNEMWAEIKAVERRSQAQIAGLAGTVQRGDRTMNQRLMQKDRLTG